MPDEPKVYRFDQADFPLVIEVGIASSHTRRGLVPDDRSSRER